MKQQIYGVDRSSLWLVAGGLAALAVLLALGLRSAGADEPAKKETKADQPKDKATAKPGDQASGRDTEQLKKLREALEKARKDMEKAQKEMRKALEQYRAEMRKALAQAGQPVPGGPFPGRFPGGPFGARGARLGALVAPPSETLIAQLGLPKDKGLVVEQVVPDSAAAKAGLKVHDVLLELNGKPIPSNAVELRKLLADLKPDTAVDLVIVRKGKQETIKGLKLSGSGKERRPGAGPTTERVPRQRDMQWQLFRRLLRPLVWGTGPVARAAAG
jgi:C-terminal processing protease CtpA/Prc